MESVDMLQDNTDWKQSVTSEKRMQFVNNLIHAMTALQETNAGNEQDLFNKASQMENEMYVNAVSRADYYNQIAQHIYKLGNTNDQTDSNSSAELEDLFSSLNLNEITFEDDDNELLVGHNNESETSQNAEQDDKITFLHVKIWFMLTHAFECMIKTENEQCTSPYCNTFRNLLIHLMTCTQSNCNENFCSQSQLLIIHWRHCTQTDCLLCKNVNEFKKPANSTVEKPWHASITFELRQHLLNKLVEAMNLLPGPIVIASMRKTEKEKYGIANSRSEYYHLLAEVIYKVQKQLDVVLNRN